jgi:hypothetical protein
MTNVKDGRARVSTLDVRRRQWLRAVVAAGGLHALGVRANDAGDVGFGADAVFADGFESTYFVDFTTQTIQDPLSLGGVWSNNTQGAGGNVAPGNLASMRIALASDGSTTIAQHAAAPVVNAYNDSFAFVPNMSSGNLRVTAVVYRNPSYNPSTNHEIEIILGCRSASGTHRWIECLWNSQGGTDIASLDGGPGSYTIIGNSVFAIGPPEDGDIWVAELLRSTNTVRWYVNGTLVCTATHAVITNLGNGAGIAGFMRQGDTHPGGLGFRSFRCEAF